MILASFQLLSSFLLCALSLTAGADYSISHRQGAAWSGHVSFRSENRVNSQLSKFFFFLSSIFSNV